jgi:hypothetical protein
MLVRLTVEVHCKNLDDNECRYRLYCNSDLLTERRWRWCNNTFIEEEIWVNLSESTNSISLVTLPYNNSTTSFEFKNCLIDDIPYNLVQSQEQSITFII